MPAVGNGNPSRYDADYDQASSSQSRMSLSRPPRPPRTIAELAELAKEGTTDDSLPLKQWLRNAEGARRRGKEALEQEDFETAFIEMARAATIVLEKLPAHRDYRTLLSSTQRHNMGLHGQEILDSLGNIKARLLKMAEDYERMPSTSASRLAPRTPASHRTSPSVSAISTPSSSSQSSHLSRPSISQTSSRSDNSYHQDESMRRSLRQPDGRGNGYTSQQQQATFDTPNERDSAREWQLEDARRREAESLQRRVDDQLRVDERRRREQEGIAQRQREAEAASQLARSTSLTSQISIPTTNTTNIAMPAPRPSAMPRTRTQLQLPLESPTRPHSNASQWSSRTAMEPPLTTTSPPPPSLNAIQYPSLMSQHQIKQGYTPSIASMFHQSPPDGVGSLYANPLPRASAPVVVPPPSGSYVPTRRAPEPPAPAPAPPPPVTQQQSQQEHKRGGGLRRVEFPYDCLNRFVSIAGINTKRNRETCGLLLGRDMGSHFVVTTLLIPKQHSTSDTCTMDEEELVLMFTEQRSLITLGWIHTHPTQSCFMSSVDLHTHSGFQMMLPESFAIVCAPKSSPSFGIFRLTDPVGLQTIINCNIKEAFHPHPDVAIYTDVDRNHVHLSSDLPLEIVDLR